jgi:F420-non-reducing hydrogenase small subunit
MVAFGACAAFGGIPGLANVFDKERIFEAVYGYSASTNNPDKVVPTPQSRVAEGELTLPSFFDDVFALHQVVPVEYFVPGCPPTPETIMTAIHALVSGEAPPVGSTVASRKAVCDECKRTRADKPRIAAYHRPHEILADPETCLLEQGLVCMGSATRGGCGCLCPSVNMPCRGCYGPMPDSLDQGADALSAITTILDASDEKTAREKLDRLPDPMGTFYRFTLPVSLLVRTPRPARV